MVSPILLPQDFAVVPIYTQYYPSSKVLQELTISTQEVWARSIFSSEVG